MVGSTPRLGFYPVVFSLVVHFHCILCFIFTMYALSILHGLNKVYIYSISPIEQLKQPEITRISTTMFHKLIVRGSRSCNRSSIQNV